MPRNENKYGMTWHEWREAAFHYGIPTRDDGTPFTRLLLMADWAAGVDPAEYARLTVSARSKRKKQAAAPMGKRVVKKPKYVFKDDKAKADSKKALYAKLRGD